MFSIDRRQIPQMPLLRRIIRFLIALAVVLSFLTGAFIGQYLVDKTARLAIQERAQLLAELERISEQNAEQKKQIAILQSSSEIDRLSVQHAQTSAAEMQDELSETRQELAFYRRVVSPEKKTNSLFIQDFRILDDSGLQYRLALARGIGKKGVVKGTVKMVFKGTIAEDERKLNLQDIIQKQTGNLAFQFRHFRLFTGSFSFPDGFKPESVEIQILPKTRGVKKISKNWNWNELVKANLNGDLLSEPDLVEQGVVNRLVKE